MQRVISERGWESMYSSRRTRNGLILAAMAFFLVSGIAACAVSLLQGGQDAGPAPVYVKNEKDAEPEKTEEAAVPQETSSPEETVTVESEEAVSEEPQYYTFCVRADISSLNLRALPDMEGKILGRLLPEQTGYVLEKGEEWSLVTTGKKSGYVNNLYIELEEIDETDFPEEYRE